MSRSIDRDRLDDLVPERFELLERLGAGSFGVVYRAFDEKHQAMVALKTLHQLQPEHLYHFKREFRSLADISHPNLVDLYELVADEEIWFFTMSHIDGVDFRTAMRRGRLEDRETASAASVPPETETLTLNAPAGSESDLTATERAATLDGEDDDAPAATVKAATLDDLDGEGETDGGAEAPEMAPPLDETYLRETLVGLVTGVQALHDYGMLHRDLKPGNVMVTDQGRAVVLDFGLVANIDGPAGSGPGDEPHSEIAGTPRYLAPELAWDAPIDEAADWYSVGVMIYEALTGRPPITADSTIAELYQKNEQPPTPIEAYRPGADPGLCQLCMDLLTIEPEARPDGSEILDRLGADPAPSGRFRIAPQKRSRNEAFVGRTESLETLEALAEKTLRDRPPSIANVRGASGVGKTALVEKFLRDWNEAHPESAILRGRCYEKESVPYKALDGVIDELVPWLEELSEGELAAILGDEGTAVAQLFPVLRQLDAVAAADGPVVTKSEAELRHEAFEALRRIVRRLTEDRPVIVCIDDVQWGDEDSVRLLDHLLSGEDSPALMVIATWRDEDAEASAFVGSYAEMQQKLGSSVRIEDLELSPLSDDAARRLARRIVGEDGGRETAADDVERIVDASGGNPLFVDELSHYTAEAGTFESDVTEFEAILRERLADLPSTARRFLEVVALAGQPIARETVRRIVGDEAAELSTVSRLRSGRLVRASGTHGEHLEPYHDRIRSALTERLAPPEKRRLHRELARAFEATEADPETIGSHLEAAGESKRAAGYLLDASEAAAEALAFQRAADLLERALALRAWPDTRRLELQRRLGELHGALGRGHRASEAYLEAADLADGLDIREYRIEAVEQLLRTGAIEEGTDLLYEELEALGFSPASNGAWMVASVLYRHWKLERRGFDFEVRDPDTIPRRQRLLLHGLTRASMILSLVGALKSSYFHYQALPLALETGHPSHLVVLLSNQAVQHRWRGRPRRQCRQLLETAREVRSECRDDGGWVRSYTIVIGGMLEYFDGHWNPARESFEEGKAILEAEAPGTVWEQAANRFFEADCLHWLGAFDQLADKVPEYFEEARRRNDDFHTVLFRTKMALLALCDDAADRADHHLDRAEDEWTRSGYHYQDFWRFYLAVNTALYRGDLEEARTLIGRGWGSLRRSLLMRSDVIGVHAWSLYGRVAAGTVAEATGWRAWRARFRTWRARRNLRDVDIDCAEASADLIEGQLAMADGTPDRADSLLEHAEAQFEAVDMAFHARAVRLRRGQLAASEDADHLTESARRWMDQHGIAVPEAMARLVIAEVPNERLPSSTRDAR